LLNVIEQVCPLISSYWLQDHIGTLASAREAAYATEAANHGRIDVAVVAELARNGIEISDFSASTCWVSPR